MLTAGMEAPDFTLPDSEGKMHTLSSYRGKNVVIYFYPKDMTPGCTQESCDFRDAFDLFAEKNTVIIGISVDSETSHSKFAEKYSLPFILLSDKEKKIVDSYGVWIEKSMYGKKYMGTERTTFLIDEKGIIKEVFNKVKVNGHVKEVLSLISR